MIYAFERSWYTKVSILCQRTAWSLLIFLNYRWLYTNLLSRKAQDVVSLWCFNFAFLRMFQQISLTNFVAIRKTWHTHPFVGSCTNSSSFLVHPNSTGCNTANGSLGECDDSKMKNGLQAFISLCVVFQAIKYTTLRKVNFPYSSTKQLSHRLPFQNTRLEVAGCSLRIALWVKCSYRSRYPEENLKVCISVTILWMKRHMPHSCKELHFSKNRGNNNNNDNNSNNIK